MLRIARLVSFKVRDANSPYFASPEQLVSILDVIREDSRARNCYYQLRISSLRPRSRIRDRDLNQMQLSHFLHPQISRPANPLYLSPRHSPLLSNIMPRKAVVAADTAMDVAENTTLRRLALAYGTPSIHLSTQSFHVSRITPFQSMLL